MSGCATDLCSGPLLFVWAGLGPKLQVMQFVNMYTNYVY